MFFQKLLCGLASLANALTRVGIPGAAFFNDADIAAKIDDFSIARNARTV